MAGTDEPVQRKISREKWIPGDSTALPNPWLDVDNFVLASDEGGQHGYQFPFTSLPIEVVYYLAKLLPKESAIALALTNKAMYSIIGSLVLRELSKLEHWNLLLLLERDSDILVACQQCNKLHSPFLRTLRGTRGIPCLRERLQTFCRREAESGRHSVLLELLGVTPALCRLLAKRYVRH